MAEPATNVDVAAILEQLRAEVQARHASAGPGEGTPGEQALRRALEEIEIARVVSAHWPLEGRNLYEQAWAFVNKVVRRYLRWYINPIVEQQNAYNDAGARAIRLLIEENAAQRREIAALKAAHETGESDQ
ncbi:MAG: hypothetical protein HC822_11370 [Oscillochloris sp.]|nr:hypothetical protein [Oscillochloris sp.]